MSAQHAVVRQSHVLPLLPGRLPARASRLTHKHLLLCLFMSRYRTMPQSASTAPTASTATRCLRLACASRAVRASIPSATTPPACTARPTSKRQDVLYSNVNESYEDAGEQRVRDVSLGQPVVQRVHAPVPARPRLRIVCAYHTHISSSHATQCRRLLSQL